MKRMLTLLVTLLFVQAAPAWAVSLRNRDAKPYNLIIHVNGSRIRTSIQPNTRKEGVCKTCKIEVEGVGTVEASGSETVVIKDGKLQKE